MWLYRVAEAQANHSFPRDGEYILRFEAWSTRAGDEEAKVQLRLDGKKLEVFEVPGSKNKPDVHELKVRVSAGRHMIATRFINDFYKPAKEDHQHHCWLRGYLNKLLLEVNVSKNCTLEVNTWLDFALCLTPPTRGGGFQFA